MPKGYRSQTCADAVYEVVASEQPARFDEVFDKVRRLGAWRPDTICQHMMLLVVNLPPAYRHWCTKRERFLFLRPDGLYELYDDAKHGVFEEGTRVEPSG